MPVKGSSKDWKKNNYDMSIKVSDSTVKKLKSGTQSGNIAAANKPGASAEFKEAVRRFYGKSTVKDAAPAKPAKTPASASKVPADKSVKTSASTSKSKSSGDVPVNKKVIASAGAVVAAGVGSKVAKTAKQNAINSARSNVAAVTAKKSGATATQKSAAKMDLGRKLGVVTKAEAKAAKSAAKLETAGTKTASLRTQAGAKATQARGVAGKIKAQGEQMTKAGLDYARTRKNKP